MYIVTLLLFSALSALFSAISLLLLITLVQGLSSGSTDGLMNFSLHTYAENLLSHINIATSPLTLLWCILAAQLFKLILHFSALIYGGHVTSSLIHNLSVAIFNRYLSFSKSFFDDASQGSLQTIFQFPRELATVYGNMQTCISVTFLLIARLTILAFLSWKLLVIFLIIGIPFVYVLKSILAKIRKVSHHRKEAALSVGREFYNIFSKVTFSKTSADPFDIRSRHKTLSAELKKQDMLSVFHQSCAHVLSQSLVVFALLGAIVFVYWSGDVSIVTFANYAIFFYIINGCIPLFSFLTNIASNLLDFSGQIDEITSLFDDDHDSDHILVTGSRVFSDFRDSIAFTNVRFSYDGSVEVLKGITFSCNKGTTTALVGPTGAGKTTLVQLLLRMYAVSGGTITIDGVSVEEYDLPSLCRAMAYVSQQTPIFHESLYENLTFGMRDTVSKQEAWSALEVVGLADVARATAKGIDTMVGDDGCQLSGGQRQQLAIARALLRKPEIIILDEPTSSMDSNTELAIKNALETMDSNTTALVIAHRLSTIQSADEIVVLEEGAIVEQGSFDDLKTANGLFSRLWSKQMSEK